MERFKNIDKKAIVREFAIAKTRKRVFQFTLTEVIVMFCKCEVKCQAVVCGHWKSKVNGVFID